MASKSNSEGNLATTDASAHVSDTMWFEQARLGMFIHWGLFSVAAGEWNGRRFYGIAEYLQQMGRIPGAEYAKLASRFDPQRFDAQEWVRVAKEGGFKYIVITAKHHEGFAMFDSPSNDFNIVKATPFARDPIKELAAAAAAEGIKLGFYYSHNLDWSDPDAYGNDWDFPVEGRDFHRYMARKGLAQVQELLTQYGPIGIFWYDIPVGTEEDAKEWAALVKRIQPTTLVNSRVGHGFHDIENFGDNDIPPPGRTTTKPWEAIFTHNNSWGFVTWDKAFKSPRDLVQTIALVASRGGNTMINVGPQSDGQFPRITAETFGAIGTWLRPNAESIYDTQASPLAVVPSWGVITFRPGRVYLHVLDRPADGQLLVPCAAIAQPTSARALATGANLDWKVRNGDLWIDLGDASDNFDLVVAVDIESDLEPVHQDSIFNMLSPQSKALELDVATVRLSGGARTERSGGWGYFGYTNYFDTIVGLTSPATGAEWDVLVVEPGRYWIDIDYAASRAQARREAVLTFASQEFPFEVQETGAPDPYRVMPTLRHSLGVVEIEQAGRHMLKLCPQPTAIGGYQITPNRPVHSSREELFTFRRIVLKPFR